MNDFIAALPKAELHVHLEGTLEAELRFALAERNGIRLPYRDVDALRESYVFHDLPSFLTVFYEGATVLVHEDDFFDLCYAYLAKAASQNVLYAEMFFDPQQHTDRGIPFATVIAGLTRARVEAERNLGIRSQLIMCFVRERSAESAMATLEAALPFKDDIVGIGLDSDEHDNPPAKFAAVFARGRAEGFRLTMHCDVDQVDTHEHLRQAIVDVGVDRIDHGVNLLDDERLVDLALERELPFTVCPVGNEIVRPGHRQSAVRAMIDRGLKVTLNSDDPAYMGGRYISESIALAASEAPLTEAELVQISRNAFEAAWIGDAERAHYLAALDAFAPSR
jgi:adenosine deaminase